MGHAMAINGLYNRYMGDCTMCSNPTPSASVRHKSDPQTMNLGVFHITTNCQK